MRLLAAVLAFALWPVTAVAATYHVHVTNESPYCVSVVGVAVPGDNAADGVSLRFPGKDSHSANLRAGKSVTATYEQPRPAKTIEVQGGPCTPTSSVPRKFANNRQTGRAQNAFKSLPGPNETIRVK